MSVCTRQRCTRPAERGFDWCGTHTTAELDRLFSIYVRERDGFCQSCGVHSSLQCSHHITRGRMAVRWDPTNAVAHCAQCHDYLTHNPAMHVEWVRAFMGEKRYQRLLDRAYGAINEYTGTRDFAARPDRPAVYQWLKGVTHEGLSGA